MPHTNISGAHSMFFDHTYRKCKLDKQAVVTPSMVKEVYETSMLSLRGHAELSHLEERLRMVLGPELYPLGLGLLTEAAVAGTLTPEAAQTLARDLPDRSPPGDLLKILEILEHDGYLRQGADGCYVFVSKLLCDWWQARFGFGYEPVREPEA